jgi:proline dehydrogenase
MGVDRTVLFALATNASLERLVKRVPGGESAAWRRASRFVAGRSRGDALAAVTQLTAQGHGASVDLFGERVRDSLCADRVVEEYVELAAALPPPPADVRLSVDLSHLALDVGTPAAAERLAAVVAALPPGSSVREASRRASTSHTATIGSATGCRGSPNHADPDTPHLRDRLVRSRIAHHHVTRRQSYRHR